MIERVIAIDWSGDKSLSGQRRKIWTAVWTASGGVTLDNGMTRDRLCEQLIAWSRETPAMVVGVDFCFSYPAWFVRECGAKSVRDFWRMVSEHLGEHWLSRDCDEARFWGRQGSRRDGKTPPQFQGEQRHRMFRRADEACKIKGKILDPAQEAKVKGIAPKSPFQIGGAGAVGTGSLRGIPYLHRLRESGFLIWPFDPPGLPSRPLLLEIYPRLLTGAVNKGSREHRIRWLEDAAANQPDYRALPTEVRRKAEASEDAFDALVSVMVMVRHRNDFLTLAQATDETILLEGSVWAAGRSLDAHEKLDKSSLPGDPAPSCAPPITPIE